MKQWINKNIGTANDAIKALLLAIFFLPMFIMWTIVCCVAWLGSQIRLINDCFRGK